MPAANEFREEVEEIAAQKYEEAKAWAAKGIHPVKLRAPPCSDRCPEALHELVDYYVPKRLDVQIRYLERRSERQEQRGEAHSDDRDVAVLGQLCIRARAYGRSDFGIETKPLWTK